MKFNNKDVYISEHAQIGKNVRIGDRAIIYDGVSIGDNSIICNDCVIGEPTASYYSDPHYTNQPTIIGPNSLVRSHSIIYSNNIFGEGLQTGHRVMIREHCKFGNRCSFGNGTELHGHCYGGDYVRVHSNADLAHLTVGSYVWIYTGARFTNDPNPPSHTTIGAYVGDYSVVAVNAVVLSGVQIGEHCLIGAASVVTKNIAAFSFARGNPAKVICPVQRIPTKEMKRNYYPWPNNFDRGMPWKEEGFESWRNKLKG